MKQPKTVCVSDVANQVRGVSYAKQDASTSPRTGHLPILRAGNITDEGLVYDDLVFVPAERITPTQRLRRNDVLIAASSGSLDVVGKAARVLDDFDGGFGAFCKVLRPRDAVDPGYFAHYFRTREYRNRVSALAAGININNLRNEDLDQLKIPLPPLPEQRRIAAILDQADALRTKRRLAVAQLDELVQAVFLEMFGDPATNPRRWAQRIAGRLGTVTTGNTPPRDDPRNYGDAIEWVKSDNLTTSTYYATKASEGLSESGMARSRMVPAGAILVTCIAGSPSSIGTAAMVNRPVAFNQQINAFVPEDGNPHFFLAQFRMGKRLVQQASTGGMKGMVSKGRLEKIRLMEPPLQLQDRFAELALHIEAMKARVRASLAQLDALFASLQHRAFRGEL